MSTRSTTHRGGVSVGVAGRPMRMWAVVRPAGSTGESNATDHPLIFGSISASDAIHPRSRSEVPGTMVPSEFLYRAQASSNGSWK